MNAPASSSLVACPCGAQFGHAIAAPHCGSDVAGAIRAIANQLGWYELNPGRWACRRCMRLSRLAKCGAPRGWLS